MKIQKLWINNDKFILTTVYDKTAWLKDNYEDRKDAANGWAPKRTLRRNGSVPILDIYKICGGDPTAARAIMSDPEAVKRIIECNPDKYQTCRGRI
ncbi:MAG: hypothetical protein P4N59_25665 [Negativicutes bacterium]|nr:hypothetical protein [Negativicutes bacterium]